MADAATASVVTLTAEVRCLMVGKRQVTLSVYRQLDEVPPGRCEPFGRVRDKERGHGDDVTVVGRDRDSGALVRSSRPRPRLIGERAFLGYPPNYVWCDLGRNGAAYPDAYPGRLEILEGLTVTPVSRIEGYTLYWRHPNRAWEWRWLSGQGSENPVHFAESQLNRIRAAAAARWDELPLIVLAGLR